MPYNFDEYKKDGLTKPRDLAWSNWAQFKQVGDKVQGYIRDAFYRKAEGLFKEQRGITLEQPDGSLINVGIKRLPFILDKTDNMRIGDPLTVQFESEAPSATKGFANTKIFSFYGAQLPENAEKLTVKECDEQSQKEGDVIAPTLDEKVDDLKASGEEVPFP